MWSENIIIFFSALFPLLLLPLLRLLLHFFFSSLSSRWLCKFSQLFDVQSVPTVVDCDRFLYPCYSNRWNFSLFFSIALSSSLLIRCSLEENRYYFDWIETHFIGSFAHANGKLNISILGRQTFLKPTKFNITVKCLLRLFYTLFYFFNETNSLFLLVCMKCRNRLTTIGADELLLEWNTMRLHASKKKRKESWHKWYENGFNEVNVCHIQINWSHCKRASRTYRLLRFDWTFQRKFTIDAK